MKTIEKIKQTLEIITAPLVAVLLIWTAVDYTAYIAGAIAVCLSILNYIELFLKRRTNV
jgi:hypothetical protein